MIFDIPNIEVFLIVLPIVAFLYSSVGHGGASGYLALMALFSFLPETMKPTALLLNVFVAGIAFYHYHKEGYFDFKLFISFAITSIPLAFVGGMIEVDATLYKKLLGLLLIFAILRMLNIIGLNKGRINKVKIWQGLLVGGIIGFFSGLIGIGGGVILTPVILLLHWGEMRTAAAVSALFIWVNSIAALLGQFSSGVHLSWDVVVLAVIALLGGYFGGYYGSKRLNNVFLRYILAFVLFIASLKLFFV